MSEPKARARRLALELPSDPIYLKALRALSGCVAAEAGFPEAECRLLSLGLEEACTNIIRHAYAGRHDRPIRVEWNLLPDCLVVELTDWGRKARPEELKSRDLSEIRPGGLGLHFIAEVFDGFEYDSGHEACNRLRLVKHRPAAERNDAPASPSRA